MVRSMWRGSGGCSEEHVEGCVMGRMGQCVMRDFQETWSVYMSQNTCS